MSVVALFRGKGPSGFGYGSTAEVVTQGVSLKGKHFLVTGSSTGLGLETVRVLAQRGAKVFAAARTLEKAETAARRVPGVIVPIACELADPDGVRACARAIQAEGVKLDGIIANAGIMAPPELQQAHGYELQFFTNHIGHFLLVSLLLNELADKGRVVVLSSALHRKAPPAGIDFDNLSGEHGYEPWQAYGQSKLANVLFAKALSKRLQGTGKTANAVHPGVIKTQLSRSLSPALRLSMALVEPLAFKSVAEGAATQVYVATRPELDGVTGEYFADCNLARPTALAQNSELGERLWRESERIVAEL